MYGGEDPLAFVISHNLTRRHLNESQRAPVAAKWAKLRHGGDRGNQHTGGKPPIGGLPQSDSKTRKDAADLLNVGVRSVDRAKKIQRDGGPELNEAVEKGEITVNAALEVAKLPEEEQKLLVSEGPEAVKKRSAEMRKSRNKPSTPAREVEESAAEDAAKPAAKKRWRPDDAERLWTKAWASLEKINKDDLSRERGLREVVAYAQRRLDEKR